MTSIIDFQGFRDAEKQFVIKELAIINKDGQLKTYLFKPPQDVFLSEKAIESNNWCTRNLHGLRWNEGDIDYAMLHNILQNDTDDVIIVKGKEKLEFLRKIVSDKVIKDVGDILPIKLLIFKSDYTCFHFGICAARNAHKLFNWINQVQHFFNDNEW